MLTLIAALTPGNQATLRVVRDQKETDLQITVGRRPKPPRK